MVGVDVWFNTEREFFVTIREDGNELATFVADCITVHYRANEKIMINVQYRGTYNSLIVADDFETTRIDDYAHEVLMNDTDSIYAYYIDDGFYEGE